MLRTFTVGFRKFKSCLLLLVALPGLTDTLALLLTRRSLLWLPMTWRRRFLTRSNFLSATLLACISGSTSIVLFSQEKPLQWTEIHTHTHTRSNCSQVFFKRAILKNFAKFIRKHLCWKLFLITLQACFPVNFPKIFRTAFFQNNSKELLLSEEICALIKFPEKIIEKFQRRCPFLLQQTWTQGP